MSANVTIGTVELDGAPPKISGLVVSPDRVGPMGIVRIELTLEEDLPDDAIEATFAGRPATDCMRTGTEPPFQIACTWTTENALFVEHGRAARQWAVKLEAKPKYVVSSMRKDFVDQQLPHRRRPAHERAEAQGRDPGRRAPR